ncbi:MAG: hypothetical protein KGR26_10850 [Cyanobacteria bacterium REEB65]|nr:hypothetical protein [Cyanobacteria bacterium REEB65]
MATASVAITPTITGIANVFPPSISDSVTTPVPSLQEVTLASGANTITLPAGTTRVCIIPPSGNAVALTLKGIAGDTGLGTFKAAPQYLAFDGTAPSTFVLSAASAMSSPVQIVGL